MAAHFFLDFLRGPIFVSRLYRRASAMSTSITPCSVDVTKAPFLAAV